jgi:predicted nucleic acid-binding protein
MKTVFIDTNILIFCALLTEDHHNAEAIQKLTELLQNDQAQLILPEVVRLEYHRKHQEIFESVKSTIERLKTAINKLDFPKYLAPEKDSILQFLDELVSSRDKNRKAVTEALNNLFEHKNVVPVQLTAEIWLNAYRRGAKGLKPFNAKDIQQGINADCLIVESLKQKNFSKSSQLLFCSNNTKDFALPDDQGKLRLHPEIANELPCAVLYYSDLFHLLEKEFRLELNEIEKKKYTQIETRYPFLSPSTYTVQINTVLDPSKMSLVENWHEILVGSLGGGLEGTDLLQENKEVSNK